MIAYVCFLFCPICGSKCLNHINFNIVDTVKLRVLKKRKIGEIWGDKLASVSFSFTTHKKQCQVPSSEDQNDNNTDFWE